MCQVHEKAKFRENVFNAITHWQVSRWKLFYFLHNKLSLQRVLEKHPFANWLRIVSQGSHY